MSSNFRATELQRRKMLTGLEQAYLAVLPTARANFGKAVIKLRQAYKEIWEKTCPKEYRACQRRAKK